MAFFKKPFFRSDYDDVEEDYTTGVLAISQGDHVTASRYLVKAAHGGHVSALWNLSILWGSGAVSPYDFDAAADCWYKAAAAGHPQAAGSLEFIKGADRGGFGSHNLAYLSAQQGRNGDLLQSTVMICGARFFEVVCQQYGATRDVLAFELDSASGTKLPSVAAFLKRTGLDTSFYAGGSYRLVPGSAADQVTDGLNELTMAMVGVGYSEEVALMARCSIVGYILAKSPFGNQTAPLLRVQDFLNG